MPSVFAKEAVLAKEAGGKPGKKKVMDLGPRSKTWWEPRGAFPCFWDIFFEPGKFPLLRR